MIIDSDIIINFLRNDKETKDKILKISKEESIKTTSINTFEILKGYYDFNKKENKIKEFLDSLQILDLDLNASIKAAEIFDKLKKRGEIIDALDLFIASITITNNEKLLTNNQSHFKKIPELILED